MRIFFNISLVISILLLPWWLSVILVAAACFLVPRFWEAVFYGLLIDALYGTDIGFYGFPYVFTASFTVMLFIISVIRKKVIW